MTTTQRAPQETGVTRRSSAPRGGRRGPVAAVRDGWQAFIARIRHATRGDRPLIVALAVVLGLGVVILSGPAQSYLDGRARVDALQIKADALDAENARLEQRVEDMQDPLNIELTARETQGFIRPGEVPYALVPPEVDRPRITAPRTAPPVDDRSWYIRAWERVRDVIG